MRPVSVELPGLEAAEVRAFVSLLRAHAAVTRDLSTELVGEHGLTINDYEVLLRLALAPERMLRRVDLAQQVLLTPSGITRLLDGLQRAGYVEKASCESDARVVYARLTDDGVERLRDASASHFASIRARFCDTFSDEELCELSGLLGRLHPAA
jgi:DNA-binding MarR family transcriptional regulator